MLYEVITHSARVSANELIHIAKPILVDKPLVGYSLTAWGCNRIIYRITSYNVCYTKLLRPDLPGETEADQHRYGNQNCSEGDEHGQDGEDKDHCATLAHARWSVNRCFSMVSCLC